MPEINKNLQAPTFPEGSFQDVEGFTQVWQEAFCTARQVQDFYENLFVDKLSTEIDRRNSETFLGFHRHHYTLDNYQGSVMIKLDNGIELIRVYDPKNKITLYTTTIHFPLPGNLLARESPYLFMKRWIMRSLPAVG